MIFNNKKKPNTTKRRENISSNGRRAATTNYYRPKQTLKATPTNKKHTNQSSSFEPVYKRFLGIDSISRLINGILLVSAVLIMLFSTTLSTDPAIQLKKNSYTYRDKQEYDQYGEELLASSLFNQSKFLFSSSTFEQKMTEKFPEISDISAVVPIGGRALSVTLRISEPVAITSSGSETGILDDSGVLVSKNISNSQDLPRLRFATPVASFTEGSRLLTTDEIGLLRKLEAELLDKPLVGNKNLLIQEVLFNVTQGQIEISFYSKDQGSATKSVVPFIAKLSTYTDNLEQVGSLIATLKQLDETGQLPTKYIDVRVPGRVFVL